MTKEQSPALPEFLEQHGFRRHPLLQNKVGHFQIAGKLEGHPIDILLDTGAASTVVDTGFCKTKKIAMRDTGHTGGGAGGINLTIQALDGAVMTLDDLPLQCDGIYAIDLSDVNTGLGSRGAGRVDAVIGVDVLRHHRAVIDYATMSLFLWHKQ